MSKPLVALIAAFAAVTARAASLPVHACVNLGNHLEAPVEGAWGRPLRDDDFRIVAAAGFDTVRLPVAWSAHAATTAPYTIAPAFLDRVGHLLTVARAAKLRVIVDDHNYDALFVDPAGHRDRLAGIWRQIAARFAAVPRDALWFEIENEPHGALTNANLMAALAPALAAIRATNPDRPVVIGGDGYSSVDSLATLDLPPDANLVPTIHDYNPFAFTHQGAGWVTPTPPLGRHFGSPADAATIAADVAKVRTYIARTGRTPLLGETGAHTTAPLTDRVAYLKAMHAAFAPLGTGVCVWAYTSTFRMYDSDARAWLPGMLGAMGLAR